jgi:hypothetical protein
VTCAEVRGQLAFVLDEPLTTGEQRQAQAHLENCPACVRWLGGQVQFVQVLRGLKTVEEAQLPWLLPEYLVRQVLAAAGDGDDAA